MLILVKLTLSMFYAEPIYETNEGMDGFFCLELVQRRRILPNFGSVPQKKGNKARSLKGLHRVLDGFSFVFSMRKLKSKFTLLAARKRPKFFSFRFDICPTDLSFVRPV